MTRMLKHDPGGLRTAQQVWRYTRISAPFRTLQANKLVVWNDREEHQDGPYSAMAALTNA